MANGLMDLGKSLVNTAGNYYAGQEGVEGATAAGRAGLATGGAIGQAASEASQFRPYTVTSNLASATTTPEGGLNVALSPEEQARQQQYLQSAQGLLGGLGVGTEQATTDLYNQIRAAQAPEELRRQQAMNEGLFARGRGGITSGQYGGTSEQFAYEQARQEAMLNAQLGARQQVGAEQLRNLQLGQGLQAAGYDPQNQAIGLFGASQIPAQLASRGQLAGAELQSQGSTAGLESLMKGEQMANLLRQQQLQSLLGSVTGSKDPLTGAFTGGLWDAATDWWNNSAVSSSTNQALNNLINSDNTMPSVAQLTATPPASPMLGQSGFLSSVPLPTSSTYSGGSLAANLTPPALPTQGQPINLSGVQAPANFGYQPAQLPII